MGKEWNGPFLGDCGGGVAAVGAATEDALHEPIYGVLLCSGVPWCDAFYDYSSHYKRYLSLGEVGGDFLKVGQNGTTAGASAVTEG